MICGLSCIGLYIYLMSHFDTISLKEGKNFLIIMPILFILAFVELFDGTDALLHVSKIAHERINHPKDVLKINDFIKVVVTDIDEKGRVNVSAKDLLPKPEKKENEPEENKKKSKKEKSDK